MIIFVFAFSAYATNEVVGSPGKVWELLVAAAERHPVPGNKEGSYLTMNSHEGAIFFVINIVGNFVSGDYLHIAYTCSMPVARISTFLLCFRV